MIVVFKIATSSFGSRQIHNGILLVYATDILYVLANSTAYTKDKESYCTKITGMILGEPVNALYASQFKQEFLRHQNSKVSLPTSIPNWSIGYVLGNFMPLASEVTGCLCIHLRVLCINLFIFSPGEQIVSKLEVFPHNTYQWFDLAGQHHSPVHPNQVVSLEYPGDKFGVFPATYRESAGRFASSEP